MLTRSLRNRILLCAPVLAGLALAGPSGAEKSFYTWRTDEGAYAFTDDARAIPEAYRAQAKRRSAGSLRGYARLTPSDERATTAYAASLDRRLAYLRELNAPAREAAAARPARGGAPLISLGLSGGDGPQIAVTPMAGDDAEPVIVETLRAHPADRIVTRNNTVVRQGDRVLTIVRSRGREWNVNEDIHIEEDLE